MFHSGTHTPTLFSLLLFLRVFVVAGSNDAFNHTYQRCRANQRCRKVTGSSGVVIDPVIFCTASIGVSPPPPVERPPGSSPQASTPVASTCPLPGSRRT